MNEERGFTYKNRVSEWEAGVAELADALDSKSSGRKAVWVRAPPPAILLSMFAFGCCRSIFGEGSAGGVFGVVWKHENYNVHS
jgi:hypothetical protein